MALTRVSGGILKQPIDVGIITATSLNASGIITAGTVQVGSATTIHTTGIDLGSGNVTSHNINSTGIITATSFVGPVTGNLTGNTSGTAGGLTGSPSISVTNITASGNVSIAGTLTYEDVTNIDAIGIITARAGINISGGTITGDGSGLTGIDAIQTGNTSVQTIDTGSDGHVKVTTEGTERLRILAGGQVAIGTVSADAASTNFDDLVVGHHGSSKRTGITIVSANNQDGAICFSDGTGGSDKQRGQIMYMHDPSTSANEYLDFYVAFSQKFRIDGDGRLLAGHNAGSSQLASAKLQVLGGNDANNIAIINSSASDADGARSGNLFFRGSQSGNEKSTLAAVTASHDGSADDQKGSLILKTNDGSDGDTPTERLRIDSGGNVGVGETSPDVRLHVKETINAAYSLANVVDEANHLLKLENPSTTANAFAGMQFRIGSGADLFFGAIQQSVNHGDFFFANQNSPNAELMRIKSTGNVGIGTDNPQKKLHVLGTSDFVVDTDADALRIGSYGEYDIALATGRNTLANSSRVYIESGDGEHLRITSSGHVIPGGDDTQDLGSTSKRWRNIYTGDLQLSNEGSSNEVDGTWGNYTIQEGEEELFIINRRSGKKFKFVLEEVK